MNGYGILVLVALVGEFVLQVTADLLNLRALRPELPEEFSDVYDADRYRRSQEYTQTTTQFGLIPASIDLALLLTFWLAGGFAWLDGQVRAFGLGPVGTGLLFIGALVLGRMLLGLPFRWYGTFVIEERFGFNTTTVATFWTDTGKRIALGIALGAPLLAAILWFFETAGGTAWLYCWGLTTSVAIVLQFVAPTWIMPLFNTFTPLERGELREAVMTYADRVGFPLDGLFVVDGSRRSTKANAFFTGFGKSRRVALYDTLTESQSTDELVAIVAHEIGHYKRGHILKGLVLGIVQSGIVFFFLSVFLRHDGLFDAFYVTAPSTHAGLVFFGLLFGPIDLALGFAVQAFSRHNEFEADAFARETTGSGERLVSALKRLAADSLQNLTPHPLYVRLHHSHPPVLERIAALRRHPGH